MKIYLARPINGCDCKSVVKYYHSLSKKLRGMGYKVLHPMASKEYLRTDKKFKAIGFGTSISTNHAIVERDKWLIHLSDIFFADLTDTNRISIGCVCELAWASLLGKHTIIAMEKNNMHRHAFILECADVIFTNLKEAVNYLVDLAVSGR